MMKCDWCVNGKMIILTTQTLVLISAMVEDFKEEFMKLSGIKRV